MNIAASLKFWVLNIHDMRKNFTELQFFQNLDI